jgi:hypothetical protein
MKRKILQLAAAVALFAAPAFAQTQPMRIHGTIESFDGQILTVKSDDGKTLKVIVPADLPIRANAKATLADIKPGDFVGSAADKGPDGKLHAEEVHIFPESMRGTGEGHRPMGPDPARSMTNGTVAMSDPEARTMTNGAITAVAGNSQNKVMTLKYKDGVQVIEVSPDTPIVTVIVADRSLLKPGSAVMTIAAQKDGGLVATNVTAEKDGLKPR